MSVVECAHQARAEINRVGPEAAEALRRDGALLVDIRPWRNRTTEGEIPGSVAIERIVLEWRLDPHGTHRLPGITEDTSVVLLCNEGYASSLAARDLKRIGLRNVADLAGGFRAWAAAGLPVREGASEAVT